MFRTERKYLAAHLLLQELTSNKVKVTADAGQQVTRIGYFPKNIRKVYSPKRLLKLSLMADATSLLEQQGFVTTRRSSKDIYDIDVSITDLGVEAYRDKVYIRRFLSSSNTIIVAVIGLLSLIGAVVKFG